MNDERQAPPRLLETNGPAGDCLREVLAHEELVPLPPRFALLRERRRRHVYRQRGLVLIGLALAALACFRSLRRDEALPKIAPELVSSLSHHAEASSSSTSTSRTAAGHREAEAASEAAHRRPPTSEPPLSAPPRAVAARTKVEPSAGSDPSVGRNPAVEAPPSSGDGSAGTAKACADLARSGAAEPALVCYAKLARGSGMTAELALFEQARLEGKVLRRPERARTTLDEYRRRFPQGSLRAEVMLAQIDWLLASGDSTRALEQVDEALASGLLRERTAELERLRSTLTAKPAIRSP
jgi:hypothetical protein